MTMLKHLKQLNTKTRAESHAGLYLVRATLSGMQTHTSAIE